MDCDIRSPRRLRRNQCLTGILQLHCWTSIAKNVPSDILRCLMKTALTARKRDRCPVKMGSAELDRRQALVSHALVKTTIPKMHAFREHVVSADTIKPPETLQKQAGVCEGCDCPSSQGKQVSAVHLQDNDWPELVLPGERRTHRGQHLPVIEHQ